MWAVERETIHHGPAMKAHLLRCRCGFCAQLGDRFEICPQYVSLEALLRLASATLLADPEQGHVSGHDNLRKLLRLWLVMAVYTPLQKRRYYGKDKT